MNETKFGHEIQKHGFKNPIHEYCDLIFFFHFQDVPVDFTPNKLIRGAGPNCIFVLDTLATHSLKIIKLSCQRLHIAQEDEIANDYLEDNAEIILEKIEDEQNEVLSDDSSELDLNQNSLRQWGRKKHHRNLAENENISGGVGNSLHATDKLTDQQTWRLEFEQVMPQLKVYVKSDVRDWRAHMNQMEMLKNNITDVSRGEVK